MDDHTRTFIAAFEEALGTLADRRHAQVGVIIWDMGSNGGEYLEDGTVIFGADVFEMAEWCASGYAPDDIWWDLARLGAHEVLHGRRPRAAGAFEEAIVETLARDAAGEILAALPNAPDPPDETHWKSARAPYAPQVRWLERLAVWLGLTATELARHLKDGLSGVRSPERALERRISTLANERRGLGLGRVRLARLGAQIADSAGVINGGAHIRPRSPVRAAEAALNDGR